MSTPPVSPERSSIFHAIPDDPTHQGVSSSSTAQETNRLAQEALAPKHFLSLGKTMVLQERYLEAISCALQGISLYESIERTDQAHIAWALHFIIITAFCRMQNPQKALEALYGATYLLQNNDLSIQLFINETGAHLFSLLKQSEQVLLSSLKGLELLETLLPRVVGNPRLIKDRTEYEGIKANLLGYVRTTHTLFPTVARQLYEKGEFTQAVDMAQLGFAYLRDLDLESPPLCAELYRLLFHAYMGKGESTAAHRTLQSWIASEREQEQSLGPTSNLNYQYQIEVKKNLAIAFSLLGQFSEAKQHIKNALILAQDFAPQNAPQNERLQQILEHIHHEQEAE